MRWRSRRRRDPGSGWLADPLHAAKYGSSLRARRATATSLIEQLKDHAIAIYDRSIADAGRGSRAGAERLAVGHAGRRACARRAAYGLDYLVVDRRLELPLAAPVRISFHLQAALTRSSSSIPPDRHLHRGHCDDRLLLGRAPPLRAARARGAAAAGHARHAGPRALLLAAGSSRRARRSLALHGLEGRAPAHYMLRHRRQGAAAPASTPILLNQRNCGGAEHLGPGLYHSGLVDDAALLIRRDRRAPTASRASWPRAIRSAATSRSAPRGDTHWARRAAHAEGVCAVSPVLDLEACVRALERGSNFIYQWNFVRNLKNRMRRKHGALPGRIRSARGSTRSAPSARFDAAYTAPYASGSAAPRTTITGRRRCASIDRIQVPALVITAEDDPFVPARVVPRSRTRGQSQRHSRRHQPRGPLAASSANTDGAKWRRLLGRAADCRLRPSGFRLMRPWILRDHRACLFRDWPAFSSLVLVCGTAPGTVVRHRAGRSRSFREPRSA